MGSDIWFLNYERRLNEHLERTGREPTDRETDAMCDAAIDDTREGLQDAADRLKEERKYNG